LATIAYDSVSETHRFLRGAEFKENVFGKILFDLL
jgi:hypothetical protein